MLKKNTVWQVSKSREALGVPQQQGIVGITWRGSSFGSAQSHQLVRGRPQESDWQGRKTLTHPKPHLERSEVREQVAGCERQEHKRLCLCRLRGEYVGELPCGPVRARVDARATDGAAVLRARVAGLTGAIKAAEGPCATFTAGRARRHATLAPACQRQIGTRLPLKTGPGMTYPLARVICV